MNASKRMTIWLSILLVMLLAIAGWSRGRLTDTRDRAYEAADSLDTSRRLVNQIDVLRDDQAIRADRPDRDREVIGLIERAASEAEIERTALARISPEAPRRVGDTEYSEHRVLVAMRRVELNQLLKFLHTAADEGQGLRARSIQLVAPQGEDDDSLWNADTTFAYISNTSVSRSDGVQTRP